MTGVGGENAQIPRETARRDAIDVARVMALAIVVLGHLLLAVIDRPHGRIRGANLLALNPGWAWLAALAPMPIFFAAAGWANAHATRITVAPRLRTLLGLGAVAACGWSVAVIATDVISGDPGIVGHGARIATQPLWFIAAYAPFAAAGAVVAQLASRHVVKTIAFCLVTLAALDIARFGFGGPSWIGWPGFFLAWGTPWVVGAWWRARRESMNFHERRCGVAIAAIACTVCVLLVAFAGYDPALIDAVDGARSNTNPPTLYTAVAALAQVGFLLTFAGALDRAGRRWRKLWARAGDAAMGIYVWHLTALALCAAVIAAGVPVPSRLTVAWWVTRPLWWAAVLAMATAFVALTAAGRAWLGRHRTDTRPIPTGRALAGVVGAAAAGAYVGLEGPGSSARAAVCSTLFVSAGLLLRAGAFGPAGAGRAALRPGDVGEDNDVGGGVTVAIEEVP
jgi:hypothetical protein